MSDDFSMDAGETAEYEITITRINQTTGLPDPVDIRLARLIFRMLSRDGTLVVTKDTQNGPTEIAVGSTSPYNAATIFFIPADTAAVVVPTVCDFSVRMIEVDGDVTDVIKEGDGKILVNPAIAST